jgi:hypothetical protein
VYLCPNSAVRVVDLDPADATNPRIDLIVLKVLDTGIGDGSTDVQLLAVTGTPAGSPVAPAVPTGAIELARVAVAAAPTGDTIVNANITDRRKSTGLFGTVRQLLANDAVSDAGIHGDLRDNAGAIERYNASLPGWVSIARRVVAWGRRITASPTTTTTTLGVLRLDNVPLKNGRSYTICTGTLHPTSSVTTDNMRLEIRYSTSGTATTASPVLPGALAFELFGNTAGLRTKYTPSADETASFLLCIARDTGSGNVQLYADGTRVTDMEVIDDGPALADTGVDI